MVFLYACKYQNFNSLLKLTNSVHHKLIIIVGISDGINFYKLMHFSDVFHLITQTFWWAVS